ncbi:MAG: hypothetical protein ACRYG8_38690 [Janthinobacterium lividum]
MQVVVARTFEWINRVRRLVTRYKRRSDIHYTFIALVYLLICFNTRQKRF